MDIDKFVYEKSVDLVEGKITETQFEWWLHEIGVGKEDALKIFEKMEMRKTIRHFKLCFVGLFVFWVFTRLFFYAITGQFHWL